MKIIIAYIIISITLVLSTLSTTDIPIILRLIGKKKGKRYGQG